MTVLSFGADWYTATNVLQDNADCVPLMDHFYELADKVEKWSGMRYSGKQCMTTGLRYGSRSRKDGRADEILVSSGVMADQMIDHIHDVGAYRTTRLDLEVTVLVDPPDRDIASDQFDRLMKMAKFGVSPLGKYKPHLVKSSTGQTLYIGSRKSAKKLFRLYDKSKDFNAEIGSIWRQEIQFGRDYANEAIKTYVGCRKTPHAVISWVSAEFYDVLEFTLLPYTPAGPILKAKIDKPETRLDKKLEWLRTCVRPTIALMIEHDMLSEALDALGLRETDQWKTDDITM